LSFLCALAETALFSLGRWQVRKLGELGPSQQRAARLLDRPDELLSALSLANTSANGMFVVTALVLSENRGWSLWVSLPVTLTTILIFGEILPKTLAVRAPVRWATVVAPAVAIVQWI